MPAPPRTDRASRLISAVPEALFAALLDPAALASWLPPRGASLEVRTFQPKTGGRFLYVLSFASAPGKTGPHSDEVSGRFVEIAPPDRLVQEVDFVSDDPAFAGTMRMTWDLHPVPGATEVAITARNVPSGIRAEDHATGLASSLENLAHFTEQL